MLPLWREFKPQKGYAGVQRKLLQLLLLSGGNAKSQEELY